MSSCQYRSHVIGKTCKELLTKTCNSVTEPFGLKLQLQPASLLSPVYAILPCSFNRRHTSKALKVLVIPLVENHPDMIIVVRLAAVAALAVVVALAGELDSCRLDLVVIHQDI